MLTKNISKYKDIFGEPIYKQDICCYRVESNGQTTIGVIQEYEDDQYYFGNNPLSDFMCGDSLQLIKIGDSNTLPQLYQMLTN